MPRAHFDTGARHLDLNRSEAAIQLRVRGCVPEQIVRREVVGKPAHLLCQIVVVHERDAVGVLGEHSQGLDSVVEHRAIQRRRQRLHRADIAVNSRQAAWIDRVEAHIRAVRVFEQVAEVAIVVGHRELHLFLVAGLAALIVVVGLGIGHQNTARSNAHGRRRPGNRLRWLTVTGSLLGGSGSRRGDRAAILPRRR